ncbi:hypothetical protein AB0K60_13565 [Thermopolyspora sp. NPDC052614]
MAVPDPVTGALTCQVSGVRLAGTFTLGPAFNVDDVKVGCTRLIVH